jgi:integration host factor subunit alpha
MTMPLTKRDIIEMIYTELNIPKKECENIVESILGVIKDELAEGNDVMISGLGKWSVKEKRARKGRNPQTGEEITIGARKIATFKGSSVLKAKINKGS